MNDVVLKYELPCGKTLLFDAADEQLVLAHKWHMVNGYVQTETGSRKAGNRKMHRLHRMILQAQNGELVDHINRNPLDNRRSNLRIANKSQNGMNRGMQANNTSGFKGVSKNYKNNKWTGKWVANICKNGQRRYLGLFPTAELAYAAYVKAATELHGEFLCV
jgi:hypothetical protein